MREKLEQAILEAYRVRAPRINPDHVKEAIKNTASDTALISFAERVGVDVHALFNDEKAVRS